MRFSTPTQIGSKPSEATSGSAISTTANANELAARPRWRSKTGSRASDGRAGDGYFSVADYPAQGQGAAYLWVQGALGGAAFVLAVIAGYAEMTDACVATGAIALGLTTYGIL